MPFPLTATPRLKKRAWAEKRAESGKSRMAKASSNDSSISLMLIEVLRLKGGLFQSKSIKRCKVYPAAIHCAYFVFTHRFPAESTKNLRRSVGPRIADTTDRRRWPEAAAPALLTCVHLRSSS